MKKLKKRWKRWKEWQKLCSFGKIKQWLIFLGIVRCTWFENFEI